MVNILRSGLPWTQPISIISPIIGAKRVGPQNRGDPVIKGAYILVNATDSPIMHIE